MIQSNKIYLDHNATTHLRACARAEILRGYDLQGNPSSVHSFGRAARSALEKAREQIAKLVNAQSSNIIFTSGATEANNTVLKGLPDCKKIFISAGEHSSVINVVPDAIRIPLHENGLIKLDALEEAIKNETEPFLVSVQAVNSETGVIQPVKEIANIVRQHGGLFHCDAVQAAGRIELDYLDYGCDFMSLSAHKVGGPFGVGALVAADLRPFEIFMSGGTQEKNRRAGTENMPAILGFAQALTSAYEQKDTFVSKLSKQHKELEDNIKQLSNGAFIAGDGAPRVCNTTCLITPDVTSERQLIFFDLEGLALSAGSACSSGTIHYSKTLKAMNVSDADSLCALRISTGWDSSDSDLEYFLEIYKKIIS